MELLQVVSRYDRATLILHVHLNEILGKVVNAIVSLMLTQLLIKILKLELKLNEIVEIARAFYFFLDLHECVLLILHYVLSCDFLPFII